MSTIDQAFVQAFARRNRRPSNSATTSTLKQRASVSRATESVEHHSVEKKSAHWVDPAKDSLLRAEAASNPIVPPPHIQAAATEAPTESGSIDKPLLSESPSRFVNEETFLQNALGTSEASTATESTAPTTAQPPYISARSRKEVAFKSTSPEPTLVQPQQLERDVATGRDGVESFADEIVTTQTPEPDTTSGTASDAASNVGQVVQQRVDTADLLANAPKSELKTDPTPAPVKASWEVDVFDIPSSVMDLFFKDELFQTVAERLNIAVSEGLSSMMVTSSKPGEGRSTVAIGMAVAAAATGIRVALVDGDLDEPTLLDDLRLDVDHGWRDAVRSGMPLSQVAVYSIEDNLTLIPLMPQASDLGSAQQDLTDMVQSLAQQFDLIIIDTSSGNGETLDQLATLVDSAVIARDASRTDNATIDELSSRLRSQGLQGIGIVENFA
jgi:Mrp family chromosome partitioning ATPase